MVTTYNIQDIKFVNDNILLLFDNKEVEISLDRISEKLKKASDFERNFFKISPSKYGVHWPLIDEDLSIDLILKNIA